MLRDTFQPPEALSHHARARASTCVNMRRRSFTPQIKHIAQRLSIHIARRRSKNLVLWVRVRAYMRVGAVYQAICNDIDCEIFNCDDVNVLYFITQKISFRW